MPRTETSYTLTSPAWAGDFLDRDHLIPGGAKLDATAFTADADGRIPLPSGTLVGRTIAERDAGTGYGPAADTDDDIYLLAFDITDASFNPDCDFYRHGGLVKINFLPGPFESLAAGLQTFVLTHYSCTIGAD